MKKGQNSNGVRDDVPSPSRSFADIDDALPVALLPSLRPHKVFGYKLRPFSFWHAAQLDWIGSPLAGHAGIMNPAELYLAVQICRTRYPQVAVRPRGRIAAWLEKRREKRCARRYPNRFAAQGPFPTFSKNPARLRGPAGEDGAELKWANPFIQENNRFALYARHYFAAPVPIVPDDAKPPGVPWYFYGVAQLRRNEPMLTKSAAWDSAIGEAAWWNAAYQGLDIMRPSDRRQIEEIQARQQSHA